MELNEWVLIIGIITVFSGTFTIIAGLFAGYIRDFRISKLENAMEALNLRVLSSLGNEKKAQNQEQESAFMANAAIILKGEGTMPEKIQKVIATDPAMAMKLAKKLGIGL